MIANYAKTALAAALFFAITAARAEAANCQGRRDTGTAVGAIGGGLAGNAISHGSAGGTIAGAVIGGVAGNVINGSNCRETQAYRYAPRRHYDKHGVAFYYDRYGHRHYYR
jgi:uncharacterized protein YcfJ